MAQVISKVLTADNFDYDMTDGFRMGVEKEWHKIAPLAPLKTTEIYDLNGNKLDATNYGISIWVKAVVPLSNFADSGVTENDFFVSGRYEYASFNKAINLGVPVNNYGVHSQDGDANIQLDMLRTGLPTAYAKPTQVNTTGIPNTAFASGRDNCLAGIKFGINNDRYCVTYDEDRYLCKATDVNTCMIPSVSIIDGVLSYTIEPGNISINQTDTNIRYVIPELFALFGQVGSTGTVQLNERPCWFLICLGVDTVQ